ncbi:S9 family peptidase [Luteipulveratus flavus]|uniref:Prolyl oligopeptidase family serine peptidase n=1 Tax=Luteipulveratus flavus TaxID=3031728 RepID=A0ABT6CC01_9MICO|nr:prolyl oligopeptidase family serine peptidase [Luteipulveratus sp. YIM 133296]MDF8266023.1 prolyl oligopeptidase family serine peptidase [Luteipulveratus sp. YIM 133296]
MTTAPYGSWASPIGIDLLTTSSVSLSSARADGDDAYWLESRPEEQGRAVLVRLRGGSTEDVTPPPFNVRSRVHEYGGGAYDVRDGVVVFSHFADGRVYVLDGGEPRPVTPDVPGNVLRYGDLRLDPPRRRILCVREDHRDGGEARNEIVALPLDGESEGEVLVTGHDFVSSPRLSPDGERLAWLTWEHPSMPWDSTEVWTGDADAGQARVIDGGEGVSVCDIGWLADGHLMYASDRSGFWNLTVDRQPVHQVDRDCTDPAWQLGGSQWCQLADGRVLMREWQDATARLVVLDLDGGGQPLEVEGLVVTSGMVAAGDGALAVASYADRPAAVVRLDPSGVATVLKVSRELPFDLGYLPVGEPVTWTNVSGADVHGFLYLPRSPEYAGPDGDRPPLIVQSHGGPTGHTTPALDLSYAFWTSRGFAVLDVNYGGSTAYGRAYRERLHGNWGVVDVDDCVSGARAMAERGLVDAGRLAISGASAGGYTTLAALAFTDVFSAGVSHFGIGDLETLARDTHKFESRYAESLIGPYPQQQQTYRERSPIHAVDRIDCAMLLLQGEDDKVVPPNQALAIAEAVRAKGRPVALVMFPGEGHGFRRADSIKDSVRAELSYYAQVFDFTPADDVPVLAIDNLAAPVG